MNPNPLDWLIRIQGTKAWMLAYGLILIPMWAGLIQGRAAMLRYFIAPILAAPAFVIAAVLVTMIRTSIIQWNPQVVSPQGFELAGLIAVILFGYVAGLAAARRTPDVTVKRGTVILGGADLQRRSCRARRRGALTLAGIAIPPNDETKHFKLIGTTGTGKTTAIRELLAAALNRGDRAVIADPDASYLTEFHDPDRGDVILNPFNTHARAWNLFGEIRSTYDVEQLARSLIPDHDGPDRIWRSYARTFFTAVTRQLHEANIRELPELYRLLTSASAEELRLLVSGTPAQPFLEASPFWPTNSFCWTSSRYSVSLLNSR